MEAIRRRLDVRRALLMRRAELIQERDEAGEGSSAWIELELLTDEMESIHGLMETLYLLSIRRRLELSVRS